MVAGSDEQKQGGEFGGSAPASMATLGVLGLQGHIDAIESGRVYGWAWNPENPEEHVSVDLYFKEKLMGSVFADRFRQDLVDVKVGDGTHAFVFDLPVKARDADSGSISVYFSETQMPLSRGSRGQFPALRDAEDPVATLSGRIDRIETSVQQVFRALHIIRRTEDDQPHAGGVQELENLHKAVSTIAGTSDAVIERMQRIEALTNASQSFIDRFEIEIHDRVTRREINDVRDEIVGLRRLLLFVGFTIFVSITGVVYVILTRI